MDNDSQTAIYFITGASGAGKTTLVTQLEEKYRTMPWAFLHFDSIGVPSLSEMEIKFGSPSAWQEAKTYEWIDKMLYDCTYEKIFLEGQVNLAFIQSGFSRHNYKNYTIILLDCSEDEMEERLTHKRMQPELFNGDMKNWLRFLRRQATELKAPCIDTSRLSKEEVLTVFAETIGL